MRTKRLIYFVFTVLLLGQNQSALAQSQSSLEKRATQAFAQQNYSAALVDYRQLLAKDQQNPNFNYHYGVCLFEVDNHFEAAKYFDVALGLKQIPDPLLYYYRAQIFQEQYFFAQAIKAYENYQELSQQTKAPQDVSRQIAECQRGLKEVSAFIRLPLLSLQTTKSPKFYAAYPFAPDDYTFYEAPEVHSKNNAKHAHVPVYAYKRGMKYRILASYGPKGTQLDLYIQKKDANNNWGSPQLISGGVNDPLSNESFGFYDAASQTLYFSSTAQSIGAHDLFKASFELTTNTASAIEKMPYPYASPSDDLFYVCDAAQNQAYFATSRQGVVGQYEIYTLQLDAPVRSNFVFAGFFTNELQPESKALSLEFTDLLTSEVYGPFVSDATGAYQVALPQKGDFLLEIQVDGASKVFQTRFSIPNLKPQTILQQQVLYFSDELGKEQWQVRNQLLEQDPATQLAGLSKLQMNVAKGGLLQAKTSVLESTKPLQASLAATWGFAAQDTAAFVTQMIDTLLAAEVSLENQVRLMELLRQDFEQQLDVREQLLAKLSQSIEQPSSATDHKELLQELAGVESALAFNQRWIQINQAANIPDLVLLDTLRAMNERHQALLLSGDSLDLLAGWTQQQAALQQYLEIAAFDGASALEAAALEQKRSLQKLIQEEAAIKAQQQQVAQQIKQLQTALPLQSKKEQAQTQLQIAARERESKALDATATQLRSEREAAAAELQVYDQASRKASYLKAAENQSLPQINLQSSYDELLAQYAQQQDLSQNLKSQLATTENGNVSTVTNPISSENGSVSTTNSENGNLGSNQELGNSEIINSNRTSTENGNTTSTNPISSENGNVSTTTNPNSSENGNVSTTTPENGNLGSNQELGNSELINSNRTSTENGNTTSINPNSSENGSISTTTNPDSFENGNVSITNSENGNLGSNQELGNSELINSNRTSTENGNTTSTNPNSSENGNVSTTTNPNSLENGSVSTSNSENGNLGSNPELGNSEIINSNRTSTENGNVTSVNPNSSENGSVSTTTNPNSSENGNVSTTNSENGNLGSNQELGNTEIINSNRTSTENGNTTSTNPNSPENGSISTTTNPISSENGNVSTSNSENGNLGSNQELGNSEIINSNRKSTENGNTTSTNPNSTENGNTTTTNTISSENGSVSITNSENGNLGSNQELGNSEIINSNRTSTENGNTTSSNPISPENGSISNTTNPISENGNVSNSNSENGNLGSNQELGNSEIINSNRTSTENGNTTSTNPISSENGNVSTTTNPTSENGNVSNSNSENGNLGSNQELGNTEIINSNRSSTENGNTTSINPNTTNPNSTENGNTTSTNPELIQEQISRFEQELLAISMMNGDEMPKTLPKIERLGLSNEALESLEQQLVLPVMDAAEPDVDVDVEAYVNYAEQRRVFEQMKNELVRNQQELRAIEEDFQAEKKEQLAALILAQGQLQERLNAQQRALVALPNQAVYEALLQQNYRPQVSAQGELAQGVRSAAVAGSVFAVQEKPAQTQATPLPVGLPCPQGLVFRVQVGAFRKPVPAERFREFTPVDGQVLANGLTVYMAGYFSSSAEALQQQKLIRTLGYPDAFVVAYQNCSRLSLAQGRALETSTTPRPQELASSSLFASPGQGLYYTVQVGVYNRPLTAEAQIGLSELIEAKTAKGQYRYASGKFGNLKDAKARQQLAVAKGITDAFIVAYYQGKRIDLAQARLLAQSGIAFEQNFEQNQVPALSAELQQKLLALEFPQMQPLKIPDPVLRYETKCTDCQAELSRYNRVGVFVYDPEKDLIMSGMQKASEWDVVQLMYMKELRKKTPTLKGETQTLELNLDGLDGAFVDWLLRQANSYELSKDQQGILQLRFVLPSVD